MKTRGLIIFLLAINFSIAAPARADMQTLYLHTSPLDARRCANDYSDDELADLIAQGEDGYEPDDCPLLANPLTGPMLHFFCQPDDEDWTRFRATPNLIYAIAATTRWNFPTQTRLELFEADGTLIAQNDHYAGKDALIWWWNTGAARMVYVRVTEINQRAECGNDQYTLTLRSFTEPPQ
ncbi:MAG: hypothetical protein HY257_12195 [Chloroflexi bacterium]|nr:hypothetical protein [Chloroflexota bacterium]